jgi:hypothetical protein
LTPWARECSGLTSKKRPEDRPPRHTFGTLHSFRIPFKISFRCLCLRNVFSTPSNEEGDSTNCPAKLLTPHIVEHQSNTLAKASFVKLARTSLVLNGSPRMQATSAYNNVNTRSQSKANREVENRPTGLVHSCIHSPLLHCVLCP